LAVSSALFIDWLVTAADHRRLGRLGRPARASAVMLVSIFGTWTAVESFRELFPARTELPFSTADLGDAIHVPPPLPDDIAVLVWSGSDPQLWFYGDRPLRTDAWSIEDVKRRRRDESVDLLFGYVQPWSGSATGLVLPYFSDDDFIALRAYLERTY